jgi:hypothetical protein
VSRAAVVAFRVGNRRLNGADAGRVVGVERDLAGDLGVLRRHDRREHLAVPKPEKMPDLVGHHRVEIEAVDAIVLGGQAHERRIDGDVSVEDLTRVGAELDDRERDRAARLPERPGVVAEQENVGVAGLIVLDLIALDRTHVEQRDPRLVTVAIGV